MCTITKSQALIYLNEGNSYQTNAKKAKEAFQSSRSLIKDDLEMAMDAFTIQQLAKNSNEKKSSSLFRYKPFDNVSISSSTIRRIKKISSIMRKIKKKMHLKTKEKEIEKIRRDDSVNKIIQNSFCTQLQHLVCLVCDRNTSRGTHGTNNLLF